MKVYRYIHAANLCITPYTELIFYFKKVNLVNCENLSFVRFKVKFRFYRESDDEQDCQRFLVDIRVGDFEVKFETWSPQ